MVSGVIGFILGAIITFVVVALVRPIGKVCSVCQNKIKEQKELEEEWKNQSSGYREK